VRLVLILAGIASLAAGCGADAKPPSVASFGTTPSSNSSGSAGSSSSSVPPGGLVAGASMSTQVGTGAAGVEYAACMRSHGVPNYPDPDDQGVLTITISAALDPSSPLFEKAVADCQKLIPAGKTLSPAKQQEMKTVALAFAACMRSHGVPHYPDPTFGSGGMVSQKIGRGDGDPSSLLFRAAQKACQSSRGNGG
jgi:hypothetical protein